MFPPIVFLALFAVLSPVVFGDIGLRRYERLQSRERSLLGKLAARVVESPKLEAVTEWLRPELVPAFRKLQENADFLKVCTRGRDILAGKGTERARSIRVDGNHRLASTGLRDERGRPAFMLRWIRTGTRWEVYGLSGDLPITDDQHKVIDIPGEPFHCSEKELAEFVAKEAAVLPLVQELEITDALHWGPGRSSKPPLLLVTTAPSLEKHAKQLPWLHHVPAAERDRWARKERDRLAQEFRVCELRIVELHRIGDFVKLGYSILDFPDGWGHSKTGGYTSLAYLEKLSDGRWVVTRLADGRTYVYHHD